VVPDSPVHVNVLVGRVLAEAVFILVIILIKDGFYRIRFDG
jgi:hypothetical protein